VLQSGTAWNDGGAGDGIQSALRSSRSEHVELVEAALAAPREAEQGAHGSGNDECITDRTMTRFAEERVLAVHHWTDRLFSFITTREHGLRFSNGHFTMIGLPGEGGRSVLRAYSIVSSNHEPHLEFLSIKVPDGSLTSRLQHVRLGDRILVGRKPTGTLRIQHLRPATNLYLLATGTGLAPFMSIIRDPETYERFEKIVVVHGVRHVGELAYREYISSHLTRHEILGDMIQRQLLYYPTVTREPFSRRGRITELIESGQMARELSLPELSPAADRVMICGSPDMLRDVRGLCQMRGFEEGTTGEPGDYVVERAFAEG
jgi:ferredoxin--NADP+ reductase